VKRLFYQESAAMKIRSFFSHDKRHSRGMTLLEVIIVVAITLLIMFSAFTVQLQSTRLADMTVTEIDLQTAACNALDSIRKDICQSGMTNTGNPRYPVLGAFSTGRAPTGTPSNFIRASTAVLPAQMTPTKSMNYLGNWGTPPDQPGEIAMQTLNFTAGQTVGGLKVPMDSGADIIWSANVVGYVLQPNKGGACNLVRMTTDGKAPRVVCPYVYRITFADYNLDNTLRYGEIRVTIFMNGRDENGNVVRSAATQVFSMRNTPGL
jgi:prepilin-type N-terminal cleavage/methylation domain-containing protein